MGIHDGPELNRPYIMFTIDPDKDPVPVAVYKVTDEAYPRAVVMSDGTTRTGNGTVVPV